MHDTIGSAGMLRGWVAVWSMQMMWLLATLTVTVGVMAVIEMLMSVRDRRARVTVPPMVPVVASGYRDRSLV